MSPIPSLFIVDDDPMLATMLEDHLNENMAVQITKFPTGEACLKELDRTPADIVVLDFHLN